MTVQITRFEHDADALRQHAGRVSKAPVARRLLALASGFGRRTAGRTRPRAAEWIDRRCETG